MVNGLLHNYKTWTGKKSSQITFIHLHIRYAILSNFYSSLYRIFCLLNGLHVSRVYDRYAQMIIHLIKILNENGWVVESIKFVLFPCKRLLWVGIRGEELELLFLKLFLCYSDTLKTVNNGYFACICKMHFRFKNIIWVYLNKNFDFMPHLCGKIFYPGYKKRIIQHVETTCPIDHTFLMERLALLIVSAEQCVDMKCH